MKIFDTACDVLQDNQQAVVVFTHGELFFHDSLGNGYTGNWVIDPDMVEEVDKVIIYYRNDAENINTLFLGTFAGTRKSSEKGRYEIRFCNLIEVGSTQSNWQEFANGGQNPISYVNK